jgi:hypothetical protein
MRVKFKDCKQKLDYFNQLNLVYRLNQYEYWFVDDVRYPVDDPIKVYCMIIRKNGKFYASVYQDENESHAGNSFYNLTPKEQRIFKQMKDLYISNIEVMKTLRGEKSC